MSLRALPLTGSVLVVVTILVGCAANTPGSQSQNTPAEYVFENVTVRGQAVGSEWVATVSWDSHWATDEFPGVHECIWAIRDANDKQLGSRTDELTIMRKVVEGLELSIDATAQPSSASISCAPARLDVGEPYSYEYSNEEPIAPEREGDGWRLRFDARWQGDGAPGPVTCTATLIGSGGDPLAEVDVNIFAADGSSVGSEIRFPASDSVASRAVQAGQLSHCRPFTG